MIVSKPLPHLSHSYLPSSLRTIGPVWPERKRFEHAEQSV